LFSKEQKAEPCDVTVDTIKTKTNNVRNQLTTLKNFKNKNE